MLREEYFKALELSNGSAGKANTMLKYIKSLEQQIAQQEAALNAYADKIYQQAQHIELLEKDIK